ncbi:hypothetical protein M9H77_07628 [Catharanthus roseus]|uniref:Uncharacterized protein n=1 Tax=Catharanthus roseus TaxID=4058 RepID=A0ACC0BVV3_CATRO|nr:hypothetical protein M9H77_07628 [Catharanthus roseus]
MVRPSGCRGDADLGPVMDRTGRVEGRPVTASSRGVRGRHSTSDIPVTPTPLAPGFHHGTGEAGQIGVEFIDQMLGATRQDSSCSTHGYSHADYGVSSSDHYVPGLADRVLEGDRVLGEEQERVQTLHIQGESDERGDDDGGDDGDGEGLDGEGGDGDGDGGDDDHNDGDDDGDEEQPLYVAPVAPASGSDGRPRHGKGKGLTGSLIPDVVLDVLVPTQKRKKVKPSDWEQTKTAEGGPVDLELIPSYGGYVAGRIWRGQDRGLLKCRSRYMALAGGS